MPLPQYAAGVGFFLSTMGAVALAARLVLCKRTTGLRGAPRIVAYALLFTTGVLVTNLVPLALGLLTRAAVLAVALLLLVAAWLLPAAVTQSSTAACGAEAPGTAGATRSSPAAAVARLTSASLSTLIAALAVVSATVYELARLKGLALLPLTHIDVMNFHLPGVARWIQSRSLWHIDQLFPYFFTGFYPNSGDTVTLAAVLPWRAAAFARYVDVAFFALTGVAVYALACQLGARRATAATVAAALAVVPSVSDYALEGLPDVVLLFALSGGVLFLVRHGCTRSRSDLMLAGLGLGIALGTKWYGATSVTAVIAVWLIASLAARRGVARTAREGLLAVAIVTVAGGIWLVRNVAESGNPLYPQKIVVFGLQLFPAPNHTILSQAGFTVVNYLGDPRILDHYIVPALRTRLGLAGVLFAIGLLATVVVALRALARTHWRPSLDYALLGVAAAAVLIALLWALTPGSAFGLRNRPVLAYANVRWLAPAPLLAAALTAAVAARRGWLRLSVEVTGLAAVVDGIRKGPGVSLSSTAIAAAVLALAALLALVWWLSTRRSWRGSRRPSAVRHRTAAALVAGGLALAVAGRFDEQRFLQHRYGPLDATIAWVEQHAAAHHRVGLAGIWDVNGISPVFPMFGPRMDNYVAYIGPLVSNQLVEYTRPGPFESAARRGRYDLLLIGRGQPPIPRAVEEHWAGSMGFVLVAASHRLALYRAPRQREAHAQRAVASANAYR
jgi:hypothetical protein